MDPIKLSIMDVQSFINKRNLLQVTSPFVRDTSTGNFDQDGLFSERIFGEIGSPDRIVRHGYLVLNTTIIHPEIYNIVKRMKGYYEDIMRGTKYAWFNRELGDFEIVDADHSKADTGYSFFLKHLPNIKWAETDSEMRKTNIKILKKNKSRWMMDRYVVIAAGIRDCRTKNGRDDYDEVNKLYRRMIEISNTLEGSDPSSPIFDTVRFNLQRCANEVFEYLFDMMSDDNGFIQKKYGSRSVARATRNVLVATEVTADMDNPESKIRADEVLVPLFQAMGAFMPLFKYHLSAIFFEGIFSQESDQVALVDPQTYNLNYVELTTDERSKYLTSDKMESMVMTFRDEALRHLPVTVISSDNKPYFLYITYRKDGKLYLGRSFNDMKTYLEENDIATGITVKDVRPLTYYEMYYHACFVATRGKHMTITRYPVTHHWSIFPARVHLASTVNFNKQLLTQAARPELGVAFPRWPEKNSASIDGMSVHPSQLKENLGGDMDGDMVNGIGILSDEGNEECADYMNHPKFIVDPTGQPMLGLSTPLSRLTFYNLTKNKV